MSFWNYLTNEEPRLPCRIERLAITLQLFGKEAVSFTSLFMLSFRWKKRMNIFLPGLARKSTKTCESARTNQFDGLCSYGISISAKLRRMKAWMIFTRYQILIIVFTFQPSERTRKFVHKASARHLLCAKVIGLSGYDCMQNINWKRGSTGFSRKLIQKISK